MASLREQVVIVGYEAHLVKSKNSFNVTEFIPLPYTSYFATIDFGVKQTANKNVAEFTVLIPSEHLTKADVGIVLTDV